MPSSVTADGLSAGVPSISCAGGFSSPAQAAAATVTSVATATSDPGLGRTLTSGTPAGPPDAAVARAPPVGSGPDSCAVVLALCLDDLVSAVGVHGIDQANVRVARQGVHLGQGRFGHRHVGRTRTSLERRGGVWPMHVA